MQKLPRKAGEGAEQASKKGKCLIGSGIDESDDFHRNGNRLPFPVKKEGSSVKDMAPDAFMRVLAVMPALILPRLPVIIR